MKGVVCGEGESRAAVSAAQGEQEGGEGTVGSGSGARREGAAIALLQLLAERVESAAMADQEGMAVGGRGRGRGRAGQGGEVGGKYTAVLLRQGLMGGVAGDSPGGRGRRATDLQSNRYIHV